MGNHLTTVWVVGKPVPVVFYIFEFQVPAVDGHRCIGIGGFAIGWCMN